MSVIPVRVAVRCRPLVPKELLEGCQNCVSFVDGDNQVIIGKDRAFTYDFTFGPESSQDEVFSLSVTKLVDGLFKGYNATILAYGQTGSGKTFTMGTNYDSAQATQDLTGIIPRAVDLLFNMVKDRLVEEDVKATVSFIEIYKEDLKDLLGTSGEPLLVRDDVNGGVKLPGLTEHVVQSTDDTLRWLEQGSSARTTGSTAMNAQSSRSHAIFTISITRTSKENNADVTKAKFHLVDLAGSERVKKTHAEGERLKEGININKGLLSLGNVISALGEDRNHIPYRDAKLTRLLQDSLGGNSHTLMIACISPADSNMEETLNTLRYADRARKIKNKPIVNRDPQTAEIMRLKQMVQELQCNLIQVRGGITITPATLQQVNNADLDTLKVENCRLRDENHQLAAELQQVVTQNADMCEKLMNAEIARDELALKIEQLKEQTKSHLQTLNTSLAGRDDDDPVTREHIQSMIEIEKSLHQLETDLENDFKAEVQDDETYDVTKKDDVSQDEVNESVVSTEHALRQAKMGRELTELNKMLQRKQQLAATMAANENKICDMRNQYESSVTNLESEVTALQKEKEGLLEALENAKVNTASNRVSEQRRKRLRDLETEMSSLKRQIQEQAKTIKIKEQSVSKVGKLNSEIQEMKRQRVKLLKQMKEDSDQFRKWKQIKDKEIMQLKNKDRKRQFEMVKKEAENASQLNVLRRKAADAAAANKRLKDALQKKKNAQEQRNKEQERCEGKGIGQRVRTSLKQEMEMLESVSSAKHHLESMMADRKELNRRLNELRGGEPPSKKRSTGNSSSAPDVQTELQIKETESELQLRNAQISELQQKLLEAENEEKTKTSFSTMVEAKCAVKFLMETVVNTKTELNKAKSRLGEEKAATGQRDVIRDELTSQVRDLQQELLSTQQEYEARIAELLKVESTVPAKSSMPPPKKVKPTAARKTSQIEYVDEISSSEDEESEEEDDEWKKTPLPQRQKTRRPKMVEKEKDRPMNKTKTCSCTRGCNSKRCGCRVGGQSCTDLCRCKNCVNTEEPTSTSTMEATHMNMSDSKISAETSSILQSTELNSTFNVDSSLDDFEKPAQSVLQEINTQTVVKKRLANDPLEGGIKRKKKLLTPKRFFDDPSILGDENSGSPF